MSIEATTLDFETPTKNRGHPFTPGNKPVTYAAKNTNQNTEFYHHSHPGFLSRLREYVQQAKVINGFNLKFDLHHLRNCDIVLPRGIKIWDCQIANFILSGQTEPYASLNECLLFFGLPVKDDKVAQFWEQGFDTCDIPLTILEEYNIGDVELTEQLMFMQMQALSEKQKNLVFDMGTDMLTLIECERNGILYNREQAYAEMAKYSAFLKEAKEELAAYLPPMGEHCRFNWDSGDHLSALLYGGSITFEWRTEEQAVYKSGDKKGQEYLKGSWHEEEVVFPPLFKPIKNTTVKKCKEEGYKGTIFYQVDDPTLKQLTTRSKASKRLLEVLDSVAKKGKVLEMLEQVEKLFNKYGWENNIVHGQYNQTVARTGRLSSKEPNMQNTPPELNTLMISRYEY